ncbi:hypothetical protein K7640_29695, partial [Micromonospora sp. PLK6-60]|uniref:hypothetical protein n=1 Tax=Micromonospora sp. PLK6-60 TaxID=2873383 RepID=UPI001CA6328F
SGVDPDRVLEAVRLLGIPADRAVPGPAVAATRPNAVPGTVRSARAGLPATATATGGSGR